MQIAMDDAQETLGMALIPYLTAFADALQASAKWVQENTGLAIAFAVGIGGLGVALLAAKAAMVSSRSAAMVLF
jgi:hypothetical protein